MNERLVVVLIVAAVFLFGGVTLFRRYTGLSKEKAFLALVASFIAAAIRIYYKTQEFRPFIRSSNEVEMNLRATAAGVLIVFLAAFVFRLWGRWIGDRATIEERQTGAAGVGAWFSASNLFVGTMIVLCAWFGYDISPLFGTVVVAGALAASPLLRMESASAIPAAGEDLSPEREKIIAMLEAGKLTPEESAELLQALGSSRSRLPQPASVPLTGSQRLMLIGAALVTLGFFLPWVVINPGQELNRLMGQMKASTNMQIPSSVFSGNIGETNSRSVKFLDDSLFGSANFEVSRRLLDDGAPLKTGSVSASGGDLLHGVGWAALGLALAAALLPYVASALDPSTLSTVRWLCLGIGSLILIYVLSHTMRFIGVGLIIVLCGYALQVYSAIQARRTDEAEVR